MLYHIIFVEINIEYVLDDLISMISKVVGSNIGTKRISQIFDGLELYFERQSI